MPDRRLRLLGTVEKAGATRFLAALDSIRPIVVVPSGLSEPVAGAALTLIALLVRIFPHTEVEGTALVGPNPWGLRRVEDAINRFQAVRPVPSVPAARDVRITIGIVTEPPTAGVVLGIGGGDWTARLGWQPQPLDSTAEGGVRHGLGLHAAACLSVGELIKSVLSPLGVHALPLRGPDDSAANQSLVWNLIDYQRAPAAPIDIAASRPLRVALAGAGSVGSSVVGMLAFCPGAQGDATVVDLEEFDSTRNPFRYPAMVGAETGSKADWAAGILEQAGWRANSYSGDVGSWNASRATPGFDGIVVSSVDDIAGRFDVADILAREVISVGVGGLAFHIQREQLGDGWACPYCEYVIAEPALTQAHLIAGQLGLTIERVIALQLPGAVVAEQDLDICVGAGKISAESAVQLRGRRLADLVAGAYAEIALPAGAATNSGSPVPETVGAVALAAPHVSWLAGVLTAAELTKSTLGLPPLERRVDVDLSGLPQGFTRRVPADASGRCACASGVRRRWMLNLYGGLTTNGTRT